MKADREWRLRDLGSALLRYRWDGMGQPARRGRVLVIDDEAEVCRLRKRILDPEHDVTTACDPEEALDVIRAGQRFDVIISDVMMPRMTGLDLHREIARLDHAQAKQIVFTTASLLPLGDVETLQRLRNLVLMKPIGVGALRELVRTRVGR